MSKRIQFEKNETFELKLNRKLKMLIKYAWFNKTKNFFSLIFLNDVGIALPFLDSSSNLPSSFIHYFDVLEESFTLFITKITTTLRKIAEMTMKKMLFYFHTHIGTKHCVKLRTRMTPNTDTFYAVKLSVVLCELISQLPVVVFFCIRKEILN